MENFLPSEVARLVLGYLEEQGCLRAYNEFLKGCRHLEECRGRSFFTRIMGLSLCDILDEFCAIQSYILDIKCGEEFKRRVLRCSSLLEKVKLFVDNNTSNDGVFMEIKTENLSRRSVQSTRRSSFKAHKSRYTRSNSCDSIITIKTEKSYSRHRTTSNERCVKDPSYDVDRRLGHGHDVARSAESLAEATNLADLPGNKGYSRNYGDQVDFQPAHRERRSLPSTSNIFVTPGSSHNHKMSGNAHSSSTQKYKENINKSIDKAFRNKNLKSIDLDEFEFRKALGLVKHSEVPDKSVHKTPSKRISTKLKQCSTINKSHTADPFPSDSLNVTTITNALLDCTELHEKLAENINKLYNSSANQKLVDDVTETNKSHNAKDDTLISKDVSKEPNEVITIDDDVQQLDTLIKSIVEKTEKDPIFDQLVNDVLAASVDSTSESDIVSRPGTSTPEKSCPSQVNVSSPSLSWVSEDKTKSFIGDKLQKHKPTLPRSAELRQKQSSINMLNVSPHKNHIRNRRYPRGGKRMDILRETYRNYLDCGNEDDNSCPAPSAKSDTPPVELQKELPQKSSQNIIILSNEIVQTAIMPNNGPLVIQKTEESTVQQPTVISHNVPTGVLHSQCDKTGTGETQQIGGVQDDPVRGTIIVSRSESSVNTVNQHPAAGPTFTDPQETSTASVVNHASIGKQNDGQVIDNAGMIQSSSDVNLQAQSSDNNTFKSFYEVPFVPGTVHYLNVHNTGKQHVEMPPPLSIAKTMPEAPFNTSTYNQHFDQTDTKMSHKDVTSLRAFRRNVVTGKPPDLVISNGKVSGVQTNVMNQTCFSKEEIMKMPTIIMLPGIHFENHSDSEKPIQTSSADEGPKSTSSTIGQLSQIITSVKRSVKPNKRKRPLMVHQPKVNWSIDSSSKNMKNSEVSGIQTLADVASTLHPVTSNQTKVLKTFISSDEPKHVIPQSHFSSVPVNAPSSCTTPAVESHGSVKKPQGLVGLSISRDNIQSNPSSEDDRFVIDEGQKNVDVNQPPNSQIVSTLAENNNDNLVRASNDTVSVNVATSSQESDATEGLEIKRNTPDLIIGKRSSVSTPRRSFSHVRVLDFNTPLRTSDDVTRKTQSSPKQSLSHKCRNTVQKTHNLRPKAHNVKSQLFPTIPEKQGKCKVMKPVTRSRSKSKDKISTEATVSNVWDDVQGMGQILRDEHSSVEAETAKEKSSNEDGGSSKTIVDELLNTDVSENETENSKKNAKDKKKLSDSEMEKKEKDQEAAIEWARIRNMDKRSWDQEMRSIVAHSHPVVIPKKKKTKIRRKISKSSISTKILEINDEVIPKTKKKNKRRKICKSSISTKILETNDELSKSTEDEGKLLEKALNKSLESPLNKDETEDNNELCSNLNDASVENTKEENCTVTRPSQSMIDLGLNPNQNDTLVDNVEQPLCRKSLRVIDVCDESGDCVIVEQDSNIALYDNDLKVTKYPNPESDHMSNKEYLLQIKHLRDSIKERTQERNENLIPLNVAKETNSKPAINAKNSLEEFSTKDYNELSESSAHTLKRSKDLKHGHSYQTSETTPENLDVAGPCSLSIHQTGEMQSKGDPVERNAEPPVPPVKITPDMPREHDFNPLSAKCNLASLLDTPFKCGILDLHMETPKFISPGFFNEIGLSTFKLLEMPTPNFPTPRVSAKDCTPGSYSSRPTDYSGSSSYYKPDEIEFNVDVAGPSRTKKAPVNSLTPLIEKENASDEDTIPQRILRPRRSPKVYYPQTHPKVIPKNTSDKSEHNETKTKTPAPAKIIIPEDLNVSSDSSSACSTCSSSNNNESLLDVKKTIMTSPIVTKKDVKNSSLNTQTKKYSTSTPNQRYENNSKSLKRNQRLSSNNSVLKVKEALQKLKKRQLMVIRKVTSSKNVNQNRSSSTNGDSIIKTVEVSPTVTQKTDKIPNSKYEKNDKKTNNNNNPSKVLGNLQRLELEEKRLRVIRKLNSSKFLPYKKDSKITVPQKKIGQNSKKTTKENIKNPSPVDKVSEITQQNSLANKSFETSTSQTKLTNKLTVSTLKSRRKSSTPRKLAKVLHELSNAGCLTTEKVEISTDLTTEKVEISTSLTTEKVEISADLTTEKVEISKETTVNHPTVPTEKQAEFNKDNRIDAKINQKLSSFVEKDDIDKCKNTDHQNSVQTKLGDDSTILEIVNHSQQSLSPKLSDNLVNEEDFVTLHLSSDEADVESSERKADEVDSSDSGDLDKIRQYIANSESGIKTPFQKNLEKEGFNESIAKRIEQDLTDSDVAAENVYSPKYLKTSSRVFTSEIREHRDKLLEDSIEPQCVPVEPSEISKVCDVATERNDGAQNSPEHAKNILKSPVYSKENNEYGEESKSLPNEETDSFAKYTHKRHKHKDIDSKVIMDTVSECNESQALNVRREDDNDSNQNSLPTVELPHTLPSAHSTPVESSQAQSVIDKPLLSELSNINSSPTSTKNITHSKARYRAKELVSINKRKSPYKIKSPIAEKMKHKSPNKKSSHTISKVNTKDHKNRDKSGGIKKDHSGGKSSNTSTKGDKNSKSKHDTNNDVEIKSEKKVENEKCKSKSDRNNSTLGADTIVNKPSVSNPQGKIITEYDDCNTDKVVWTNFELNISSPGFVNVAQQASRKKGKKNQKPFDASTFTLSATIVNSETKSEEVRSIHITEFKELLTMTPNHYLKGHLQRKEKKILQIRKQKMALQNSPSKRPLDLLFDEMSDSSPSKSVLDIADLKKDNTESLHCVRNESEIITAVSSILMEDDPARNAFFHTPYFLSTDNVDAACETLTKAIIEDEFVEKLNEQEPTSVAESKIETSQEQNEVDDLMNFACINENTASQEVNTVGATVKQNEKRKRQNDDDESNAKIIKLSLFKGIDIECVLKKLHGD